jgi:DNA (cytosine-5)-methyltransferase 1
MKINPKELDDFDFLIAGFPCQSFSIVGKRKGFEDERGQIIYGLEKIINIKKPKVLLLENVKGLVSINKGNDLKEIIKILTNCNYQIFYQVIESAEFGIPQGRERIYIVGIRNDLYVKEFQFPTKMKQNFDIKTFLLEESDEFILKNSYLDTFIKYLQNTYNKNKFIIEDLLKEEYLILDSRQSDLRLYRNKIPTLRAGRQGILYIKNKQIRKLSGMEALLLQGFSLEIGKKVQANFTQTEILSWAGNAMTVNVMREIGKKILDTYEKFS